VLLAKSARTTVSRSVRACAQTRPEQLYPGPQKHGDGNTEDDEDFLVFARLALGRGLGCDYWACRAAADPPPAPSPTGNGFSGSFLQALPDDPIQL